MRWTEEEFAALLGRGNVREVGAPAVRSTPSIALPPQPEPSTDRYRSKTERAYAALLTMRQQAGELRQWWYEPMKGCYLAPKTSYTPDFLLWYPDNHLEFHEVKGPHIWEKDWIRAKQAAALYPCFLFILAQWKDHTWHWKRIPAV